MNLFQVPGWSVPAVASNASNNTHTGKRKKRRNSQRPVERSDTGNNLERKKRKRTSNEDDAVKTVPMSDAKGKSRSLTNSRLSSSPDTTGLTSLQKNLSDKLDGARFRWINVQLYNSHSTDAYNMMREDPNLYEEYHVGFRRQVQSWPANPVSHYITKFQNYAPKTVIADLGCGDAALARALLPKGLIVLSFDLVSDGAFVIEADVCGRLPLPGSEDVEEGSVVDAVVCSLSLMASNWLNSAREAWRVLKPGGEFHIAEVASRFKDVEAFTALINSIGFRLLSKNDHNTHFTIFEWKKVPREAKTEAEWTRMTSQSNVLKPCEYKRR